MKESVVQRQILEYLGLRADVIAWRQNTGAVKIDGRYVKFGLKGAADITGLMLPGGRRLEIECKGTGGKQSTDQKKFQIFIEQMGGLYILAYDLDDVILAMEDVV